MRIVLTAVTAGLLVAALAACQRKAETKAPAAPAAPLTFIQTSPDATVRLVLDPGVGARPGLRGKLYGDGVKELTSFADQAHSDRARLSQKGYPSPAYERDLVWSLTAATPNLASARETWSDYTGGAHPNHGWLGVIWDVHSDREIPRGELFRVDADQGQLDALLCQAVKAAKSRRAGAAAINEEVGTWSCPKWDDSNFVFAPSTTAGKIGGLTFLFDPYVLGPYAEGDYAVTVPQSDFRIALAPAYADEFAGAPAPEPAARPAPKR